MHQRQKRLVRSAALAALATMLAVPVTASVATASPTGPAAVVDTGVPTVDEADFRGAPAGEERTTDLAVRYGQPSARVTHAGAAYVKVHFNSLRLVPGDYVTVADPTGREVHTYSTDPTRGVAAPGDSAYTIHRTRGFAAMSIEGDTAVVTLHRAADSRTDAATLDRRGYGARVDRFWRGYTTAEIAARSVGTTAP